ncbi:MAG: aminopeptidase P family protein [Ruminococcus sp.]|nr:aminopeptidase P family protein [Ruminococcus sp.]
MLERIDKLRSLLEDNVAFLITSDVNRFYYTGFKSSAGVIFVTADKAFLLVDFRYVEAAKKRIESNIEVICYNKLTDSINELVKLCGIKKVIIEDEDITIGRLSRLSKDLKATIVTDFKLSDKILNFRMIKSADEIEKIKTAQKITEKSYLELLNSIKAGVSEKKLSLELEHLMKLNGAERIAFDLITISGRNTSLPHGVPSDNILKDGDFITFDIGAVYDGYHSDMTRTVALGHASDKMREVYSVVLEAHKRAALKINVGNTCADVDNAARDYIASKGYGEYFGHSTGHGVGLEIHEKPTVYLTNDTVLKPDMVITNEPGIYLPNEFGVRIEDMYLVTDNGYEDLAFIDKELIII